jgi:hypothetical protein
MKKRKGALIKRGQNLEMSWLRNVKMKHIKGALIRKE